MSELGNIDNWVGHLKEIILDSAAQNLAIIQEIAQDSTRISVEDVPRIQQLLADQQRITDELSAISEDLGGRTAATAGHAGGLIQKHLDTVNIAGSLATFLANLDFFMVENPSIAEQLLTGLAGVPNALAESLVKLDGKNFEVWQDAVSREIRRRKIHKSSG